MATCLLDGSSYRLSKPSSKSQKSVIHVKLTDAAQKAIKEYQAIKGTCLGSAQITFKSGRGMIVLPGTLGKTKKFDFTMSNMSADEIQTSQCLQHDALNYNVMSVCGMQKKIAISATDDVFETAKNNMKLADAENKKSWAPEVLSKPSGPKIGRTVKQPVRPSTLAASKPNCPPVSPTRPVQRATPSPQFGVTQRSPGDRPTAARPAARPNEFNPEFGRQRTRPVTSHMDSRAHRNSGAVGNSVKPLGASSASNYDFRERIVHLLAVQPFSRAELWAKLYSGSDDVQSRGAKSLALDAVLDEVALRKADERFTLCLPLLREVKLDWPLYTVDQRRRVERKLSGVHESFSSASNSPALSPCPSSTSSLHGSPTTRQKRVAPSGDPIVYSEPNVKKSRIAHPVPISAPVRAANFNTKQVPRTMSPPEGCENTPSAPVVEPDYVSIYPPVKTVAQRNKYKADFNAEYPEYLRLHNEMASRLKIFNDLKNNLLNCDGLKGNFQQIRLAIFAEYNTLRHDEQYTADRQRIHYLHSKLGYIKDLVSSYDLQQLS